MRAAAITSAAAPLVLPVGALVALGVAAVFALRYIKRESQPGGLLRPGSFNPASTENLAYRGANAIVQTYTGDAGATVGTSFFEWINPGRVEAERRALYGDGQRVAAAPKWEDELGPAWEMATAQSSRQNEMLRRGVPIL